MKLLIPILTMVLVSILPGCHPNPVLNVPVVTTLQVTGAGQTTANGGGEVVSDGGARVQERGVCWGKSAMPAINDSRTVEGWGLGSFTCPLTGLAAETHYYARAYATNSEGTGYGNQVEFQTLPPYSGTVTDADGNSYHTILIGGQEWMAENLRTNRLSDGTPIAQVTGETEWTMQPAAAWCWPNNDSALLGKIYGALYNGYTAAISGICPAGWHVPTDTDWIALGEALKGDPIAGAKMKTTGTLEAATGLWKAPNTGATNESRFSALPGGYRYGDRGKFEGLNVRAFFWTSSPDGKGGLYYRNLYHDNTDLYKSGTGNMLFGFSIRCLKNS